MFNRTNQFSRIYKELETIKALNKFALFECYGDRIATFCYREDGVYHQFCVICDDDLSREMKISDLLELKNTTFFSHTVFLEQNKNAREQIASISWSMYGISGLN